MSSILVVGRDGIAVQSASAALTAGEHTVTRVTSGEDALRALRDAPMPDDARPLIEGENAQELLRL